MYKLFILLTLQYSYVKGEGLLKFNLKSIY